MDSIDRKILCELEANARISNTDLADAVGLSASACLRRVQTLEQNGTILGYREVLNRELISRGFIVMVGVGLARHQKADQVEFESAMQEAEEVLECHSIAGIFEYLLRVEVADLESYKRFHTDVLGSVERVGSIVPNIVLASPKDLRR